MVGGKRVQGGLEKDQGLMSSPRGPNMSATGMMLLLLSLTPALVPYLDQASSILLFLSGQLRYSLSTQ